MIDPAEFAEYEAWRIKKMREQIDVSIEAFNLEQQVNMLAFDDGVDALRLEIQANPKWSVEDVNDFLHAADKAKAHCRFRKP